MRRLYAIQYLRALAALAVVVFHAAERTGGHFTIGAAGVDVFFVISGFIMWTLSRARPMTPALFLRDRLERIAPAYWIATAVMVAGALVGLFPNLKLTAGYVLGSLLFIPWRSPGTGNVWPVLVQGWTLNYEIFFYVVFACTLLLPSARRLAALSAALLAFAALGFALQGDNALLETYTGPIILEFLLGALIGKFWLEGRVVSSATGLGLVLVALLGFAFAGLTGAGFTPFVFGPLAAALVLGALALERDGLVEFWRPAAYLGDTSYSIYLWHGLAISVVARATVALSLPFWVALPLAVTGGTMLGVAAYELLEKPIARALKARRHAGWQPWRLLRIRWLRARVRP